MCYSHALYPGRQYRHLHLCRQLGTGRPDQADRRRLAGRRHQKGEHRQRQDRARCLRKNHRVLQSCGGGLLPDADLQPHDGRLDRQDRVRHPRPHHNSNPCRRQHHEECLHHQQPRRRAIRMPRGATVKRCSMPVVRISR